MRAGVHYHLHAPVDVHASTTVMGWSAKVMEAEAPEEKEV